MAVVAIDQIGPPRRDVFEALGGFDSEFFMFADELDLSWRVWLSHCSHISRTNLACMT